MNLTDSAQKKVPQRMCVACRGSFDKRSLLRIVRAPDGSVSVDTTGKKSGRGAYICGNEKCLQKCAKGLLRKHLGCEIPPEIYEEIRRIHCEEK